MVEGREPPNGDWLTVALVSISGHAPRVLFGMRYVLYCRRYATAGMWNIEIAERGFYRAKSAV